MLKKFTSMAVLLSILAIMPMAFAEEHEETEEIPVSITTDQIVIVAVGIFGGLTTAYLGYRKARRKDPNLRFEITRFGDRVIISIIASLGIAVGSAADIVELTLFTMFLLYTSTIGTAELVLQLNALRGTPPPPG